MYIRPLASTVKQGLDLQGGTHVVLQAKDTPQLRVNDDALDRATHIIERRVNALGLTEPVVQRQGKDRIIVELPGVKDPEKPSTCSARRPCWSSRIPRARRS